jgi:non-heme chloroperoxidase
MAPLTGADQRALLDKTGLIAEVIGFLDGGEAIRYLSRHGSARVARLILVDATGPRVIG